MFKEGQGLFHRHIQHIIDTLSLIFDFQGLPVIALAAADFAGHIDIRQEMHLDLQDTVSAAGLTAAALHVEAETAFLVASRFGIRRGRKEISDQIKDSRIGRRVGTGCPSDRGLVDIDDLVQLLQTQNIFMLARE